VEEFCEYALTYKRVASALVPSSEFPNQAQTLCNQLREGDITYFDAYYTPRQAKDHFKDEVPEGVFRMVRSFFAGIFGSVVGLIGLIATVIGIVSTVILMLLGIKQLFPDLFPKLFPKSDSPRRRSRRK